MTEPRPLEVNKLYILVDGAGRVSPVVKLEQVGFDPNHIELELSFRNTDNQVTITVNQNRLGAEDTQVCDIRPVTDVEMQNGKESSVDEESRPSNSNGKI